MGIDCVRRGDRCATDADGRREILGVVHECRGAVVGQLTFGFERPAVESWLTTTAWGSIGELRDDAMLDLGHLPAQEVHGPDDDARRRLAILAGQLATHDETHRPNSVDGLIDCCCRTFINDSRRLQSVKSLKLLNREESCRAEEAFLVHDLSF